MSRICPDIPRSAISTIPQSHKITADKQIILGPSIAYNLDNVKYFRGYPDANSGMN